MIRNNPRYLQDTTSSVHVYLAFTVSMSDHTPKLIGTYSHEFTWTLQWRKLRELMLNRQKAFTASDVISKMFLDKNK